MPTPSCLPLNGFLSLSLGVMAVGLSYTVLIRIFLFLACIAWTGQGHGSSLVVGRWGGR